MRAIPARCLAALACLFLAGSARAGYMFEFDTAGTPTTSFTVGAGQTVGVEVYLKETTPDSSLKNSGLFSSEVSVSYNNPAGLVSVTDTNANSEFNNVQTTPGSGSVDLNVVRFSLSPPFYVAADSQDRVLLGTFLFQGLNVGTVTLTANDPSASNPGGQEQTIFGDFTSPTAISSASASLTVVPEPGTLILSGIGVASLLGYVGFRKRRNV